MSGDPAAAFRAAMEQAGIVVKPPLIADGNLHRVHIEGDRAGTRNGFYVLHLDERSAGAFGCYKRGIKQTWKANGAPLSDFDQVALLRKIEEDRRRREREEAKRHQDAAAVADRLWATYSTASADHPYLRRKRVQAHGCRQDGDGRLVAPLTDTSGKVWSLQTIDHDGAKLFMPGGRKAGCFYMLGEVGDRLVIAEGFSTSASIHEATDLPVAVAFDAGNLEAVARAIRKQWPRATIVIAADDDRETKGPPIDNPGMHYAGNAADAVGAAVAKPLFQDPVGKSDFNDLEVSEGREVVARIILGAFPRPDREPDEKWREQLRRAIEEMNRKHFVAMLDGRGVIGSIVHDEAHNRDRLVFSREADIRLAYRNRKVPVDVSGKLDDLGGAWIEHEDRRTYERIALITSGPVPRGTFNLWRGLGVKAKPGDWSTIRRHLVDIVCSGDLLHFEWLERWMARLVQRPGDPAEVAVVLRGLKGTGKGMVGQILMRMFRNHALHILHARHLTGNFNAHLADTLFLFVDEAFWGGDKQGEGVLKGLITERTLLIEPKGIDPFAVPNRLKILISSNADWVVPATGDERRFLALNVSDQRRGDRVYFAKLAAAIEGDELAAFLQHLLKLDLAEFDHRNPPHTEALDQQKLISGSSVQKFWQDILTSGEVPGASPEQPWPEDVVTQALHEAYIEYARNHGDRHPMSDVQMAKELATLFPEGRLQRYRPHKIWNGKPKPPRYKLPYLAVARNAFLAALAIDPDHYEWGDDEGEPQ